MFTINYWERVCILNLLRKQTPTNQEENPTSQTEKFGRGQAQTFHRADGAGSSRALGRLAPAPQPVSAPRQWYRGNSLKLAVLEVFTAEKSPTSRGAFFFWQPIYQQIIGNRNTKSGSRVPVIKEIQKEMSSGEDGRSTFHPISPANYNKRVWRKRIR